MNILDGSLEIIASSNEFEKSFARFLDKAEDVSAFAKLPEQFGFCIQYTDTRANIRNYFPDFILRLEDGSRWIAETKGGENVVMKDQAALNWCETATMLTGVSCNYIKVLQKEFEELHPDSLEELTIALKIASNSTREILLQNNKSNMGELLVAMVSAVMQGVDLWLNLKDRAKLKEAIGSVKAIQSLPATQEEGRVLELLIPESTLDALTKRVDECFRKFERVLDKDGFFEEEIDQATDAVLACVCRELKRIHKINGNIPDGRLQQYWTRYRCDLKS